MKAYETLELEVIKFEAQDVITASGENEVQVPDHDLTLEDMGISTDQIPDGMTEQEVVDAMMNGGILINPGNGSGSVIYMPGTPEYEEAMDQITNS